MLSVQVEYWKLQENKRHNLVTEAQGQENLQLGWSTLGETSRHNFVTEAQGWSNLAENKRHNVATETEAQRHNVTTESESQRHNLVTEDQSWVNLAENERSHRANESIGWANANANMIASQAKAQEAQTHYLGYILDTKEYGLAQRNADIRQQEADIAQQRADTEQYRVDQSIAQGWITANYQGQNAASNASNAESQATHVATERGNVWVNAFLGISKEARGWVNILNPIGGNE